jgi:FixJ family two-component response regulator
MIAMLVNQDDTGMRSGRSDEFRVHEILLVDDNLGLQEVLTDYLSYDGVAVTPVPDGASCLDTVLRRVPAAIVLDITTPQRSGLEVLRSLKASQCPSPVVVVSGASDVRTAVEAMKCGAVDFLERPLEAGALVALLRSAISVKQRGAQDSIGEAPTSTAGSSAMFPGAELLTRRERDVLGQVAAGASNKEAGRLLGISPRTVEVHRARIMEKLGARNAADLVRIVLSEAR